MYEYLKGKLISFDTNSAILDVNNVGYKIFVPLSAFSNLAINKEMIFFTSLVVKEDSHTLYGFLSKDERNLFELLTTVSGIGAKTGLSLIGHLEFSNLHTAISNGDAKIISRVPGIGKKTAQRLIIELRDKFNGLNKKNNINFAFSAPQNTPQSDAINALINLGYNPIKAQKAVSSILKEIPNEPDVANLITLALKKI